MTPSDNPSLEEAVESALRVLHLVMDLASHAEVSNGTRQAVGMLALEALKPLERLYAAMPVTLVTSRLDRWADKTNHVAALRELADGIEQYQRRPVVKVAE